MSLPARHHRSNPFGLMQGVAVALCASLCVSLSSGLSTAHAQEAPLTGTLKKIRDSGSISLGHRTDSAPFSFIGAERQPDGYSVDLCKRVVGALKERLKLADLKINWVPVTSASRIEDVTSGKVDLECGTTSTTLDRQEKVDFSNLIFVDGVGLMVRTGGGIQRVSDLAGRKVAVTYGSTTEAALRRALRDRMVNAEILGVKTEVEGLAAVEGGTVDAYANDRLILIGVARKAKDLKALSLVDEDLSFEPYALMMRRDADFRLAVNRALSGVYRSAAIGEIYDRWFAGFGQPGNLLAAMYYLNAIPE